MLLSLLPSVLGSRDSSSLSDLEYKEKRRKGKKPGSKTVTSQMPVATDGAKKMPSEVLGTVGKDERITEAWRRKGKKI